jgi:Rod binding domain-containing protein
MSILSASGATSYDPSLTSASLPPVSQALQPADIRNGNTQAKQAYQEALGFEDILMQELTQELASTVSSPSDDSSDGSDGSDDSSDDSSGGILGSDASTSGFASMIPTALTQSLMSSGGVGIADQLAKAIDPQIGTPQGEASSTSSSSTSSSSSSSSSTSTSSTTGASAS